MSSPETYPPGLELLLGTSLGEGATTLFHLLIPPIHWSIIRCNQRLQLSDGGTTEQLPPDWRATVSSDPSGTSILLNYRTQIGDEPLSEQLNEIKIMEVEKDKVVVVSRKGQGAVMLSVQDYIDPAKVAQLPNLNVVECFRGGDRLWQLEALVKDKLFQHEVTLGEQWHAKQAQKSKRSPYDTNMTREQIEEAEKRRKQQHDQRHAYPSPLFVPPPSFPSSDPFRIGRSDLDPFSGMDGGMLMDPRGFRTGGGRLPGGVGPPRFDPFGPVMPRGGGRGMFAGAPPMPFGGPDNDLEMPSRGAGYDDMFM